MSTWQRKKEREKDKKWEKVVLDAFCIALATELKAGVLTGDGEFKTIDGLKLIWIK